MTAGRVAVYLFALTVEPHTPDDIRLVFLCCKRRSFRVGGFFGQCVDTGTAYILLLDGIGMQGNEKVGTCVTGDRDPVPQVKKYVAISC